MANKKQKELRQPDAFQRAGIEASSWLDGKEKYILGLVLALIVIGGCWALVDYFSDRGQRNAEQLLGAALEPVTRPVAEPNTPPPANASEEQKPFASEKEKDEAIIASLTKFREAHKGTRSANTAALPLGDAYYRQGQFDEALAAYSDYLKNAPSSDPLRVLAFEGQGYAYEAKNDLDKALAAFDEMGKLGDNDFLEGMGRFHHARVLILQGKKEDAAKELAQIPGEHPNSAAARMATERMNVLASEGVKVPPVAQPKPAELDGGIAQQGS